MMAAQPRRDVEPLRATEDTPLLRTLLLTDLCDSTEIVEKIGDVASAKLFRQHDQLVLELQQRWRGRLIDRSDGLLLLFERPIDGLGFALDYMRALKPLGEANDITLCARSGLHVGEVLTWRNSVEAVQQGAKPLEVEGLTKPMAARLMSLARPGQILLSSVAEPLVHRASRELGERGENLLWKTHGRWQFKGVPGAQEIYEVGEAGIAPLRLPKNGPKAWRDVPMWRRPASLVAEAMLCVIVGLVLWFSFKPEPAIAFAERDWVVVSDLRNLTGDAHLDDSLEQAFRISLEQSSYVNVLSDLKVRETLKRMQKPEDFLLDRGTASEIALRDGARAVILPTVAEVGGRLRFSAEVVDPHTQTTVYAFTADGKGLGSALESVDEVTEQLREKLGEAFQDIERTSLPLPNVATPSLDALKAFALARNIANTTRDRDQALGLYQRALQLDPQFALAHADMARLHASFGEVALAGAEWRKAIAIPQRLSTQERQLIDLMLIQHGATETYFRKAKQYVALYPDDYRTLGRLAANQWHQRNDFSTAERMVRSTLKPQNERLGTSHYSLGIYLLGQEKYELALAEFRRARDAGFVGSGEYFARTFDVHGKHAESDKVFLASTTGRNGWQSEAAVITWIDRGHSSLAADAAKAWLSEATAADDVLEALRARAAMATVALMTGESNAVAARASVRALQSATETTGAKADTFYPPASTELRLYAGLLAAQMDDAAGVAQALRQTEGSTSVADYPTVAQLRQVLLAEKDRLAGKPHLAVARLRSMAKRDDALIAAHWALMRAEQAAGNAAGAEQQSDWLSKHRGRVFAEQTTTELLKFFNIAISADARKMQTRTKQ